MNSVIITSELIEPYKLIEDYQNKNCDLKFSGGQSIFIGYMRETNAVRNDVISMKLEHYPVVKQAMLETIDMTLGENKTEKTMDAWNAALDFVIDAMQNAAKAIDMRETSINEQQEIKQAS